MSGQREKDHDPGQRDCRTALSSGSQSASNQYKNLGLQKVDKEDRQKVNDAGLARLKQPRCTGFSCNDGSKS